MQERRILYFPKDAIPLTAKTLFNYNTGVADVASGIPAGLTIHNLYIPFKYQVIGTTQNTPSPSSWTSSVQLVDGIKLNEPSNSRDTIWVGTGARNQWPTSTGGGTNPTNRVGTLFRGASTQAYQIYYALFPTAAPSTSSVNFTQATNGMYVKYSFGSSPITTSGISSGTTQFGEGSKTYYFKEPNGPLYYD